MQKIKKKVSGLSNLKSSYGRILSFAGKSPPKPIIGTNAYSKGDNTDLESILGEKGFARYFSEEGKTEETTELTIDTAAWEKMVPDVETAPYVMPTSSFTSTDRRDEVVLMSAAPPVGHYNPKYKSTDRHVKSVISSTFRSRDKKKLSGGHMSASPPLVMAPRSGGNRKESIVEKVRNEAIQGYRPSSAQERGEALQEAGGPSRRIVFSQASAAATVHQISPQHRRKQSAKSQRRPQTARERPSTLCTAPLEQRLRPSSAHPRARSTQSSTAMHATPVPPPEPPSGSARPRSAPARQNARSGLSVGAKRPQTARNRSAGGWDRAGEQTNTHVDTYTLSLKSQREEGPTRQAGKAAPRGSAASLIFPARYQSRHLHRPEGRSSIFSPRDSTFNARIGGFTTPYEYSQPVEAPSAGVCYSVPEDDFFEPEEDEYLAAEGVAGYDALRAGYDALTVEGCGFRI